MNWYLQAMKKYADFNGRARRKEYWLYQLFLYLIAIAVGILLGVIAGTMAASQDTIITLVRIFAGLVVLVHIIPGLAVTVRRLHDTGKSAWWLLIGLVPLIGPIVMLVLVCQDSEPGTNVYGPNPKAVETLTA